MFVFINENHTVTRMLSSGGEREAAGTMFVNYLVQDNDYAKNYYESDESRGDDEDDNLDADGYY